MTIVTEEIAASTVHEQQIVTIGVARQMIHALRAVPETQARVAVADQRNRVPG